MLEDLELTLWRLRPNLPLVLARLRPTERNRLVTVQRRQIAVLDRLHHLRALPPQLLLQQRHHEDITQRTME